MINFDNRVVVISGAGAGLGRSHALAFASRGARVLVNDVAGAEAGEKPADAVVSAIRSAGGEAVANYDSVEQGERLVEAAMDSWGRVDVVVNNAGILRDRAFANMTEDDWEAISRVHLLGAYKVTHSAWLQMKAASYGRIINTCSAALYGNFGQANYSTAKSGLWGFTRTLAIEGRRYGICANAIAPLADSQLMRTILSAEQAESLKPEFVSALVVKLCSESHQETGQLYEVGGGWISQVRVQRAQGFMCKSAAEDPDAVAANWEKVCDFSNPAYPQVGNDSIEQLMAHSIVSA